MNGPPLGVWSPLWRDDYLQVNAQQESEFGTPTGYVDARQYRGKAASESLPHALVEGIPNDG